MTASPAQRFRDLQRRLWRYDYLTRVAYFDGATAAPEKGAGARGDAMSWLAEERHRLLTGNEARELVAELDELERAGSLDAQTVLELSVFRRDLHEASCIPTDEEAEFTRLTCEAEAVWHRVKRTGDWDAFAPYVDDIVEASKRRAMRLDPARDPYDVLLDQFERGLTQQQFDEFCKQVDTAVSPLVQAIVDRGEQPSAPFLAARVPHDVQLALSRDLMALLGLDMKGAALAETEHPFSDGFAAGDVRVVTHIYENDALSNVFSIAHESGHALYEQNVDAAFDRTCLAGGTSMGVHESQSRLMENMVARSRAFMGPLLALLKKHVPEVYGDVTEDELYRAANIARPSLVRIEADELTYTLHIMVRYEVERALFLGEATAADVPRLWNEAVERHLGIEVPNNTLGCLQDSHWSAGSFAYFPSYALGSAYAAQFVRAMGRSGVDFETACAAGDLAPVNAWLTQNVWRWGRAKDGARVVEDACGEPFDAACYCDYLVGKFSALYGL